MITFSLEMGSQRAKKSCAYLTACAGLLRYKQEAYGMPRASSICCEPQCPQASTHRGRCKQHAAEHERVLKQSIATKRDEQTSRRSRQRIVQYWKEIYGNWCPGYKRPGHRAHDLTAQHWQALSDGGDPNQQLSVLCRSCNSRHGAEVVAARRLRYR